MRVLNQDLPYAFLKQKYVFLLQHNFFYSATTHEHFPMSIYVLSISKIFFSFFNLCIIDIHSLEVHVIL